MAVVEGGSGTVNRADVDIGNNLQVNLPGYDVNGVIRGGGPQQAGAVSIFTESDPGTQTGSRLVVPPEADHDYRFRLMETLLDHEVLNYTAQNTGKYTYSNTTMTVTWTASGLTTNGGSIVTTTTGARVRTYATFPLFTVGMLYADIRFAFTAQMPTNTTIDVGFFADNGSNPFTPTDGVYFSFDSSGFNGVVVNGGAVTQVPLLGLPLSSNAFVKLTIACSNKRVEFWANDVLYGVIEQPLSTAGPFLSASLPFAIRHAITGGAASGVIQAKLASYQVTLGGTGIVSYPDVQGARCWGTHQGLGGGTMGSLANYANSAAATAGAGSNTAAIVTGLGGQVGLNGGATSNTDLILTSYQVPAGTLAVQGRRLVLRGVQISAANIGAAVATTDTTLAYSLAFGHTAVSLATAEAATTKAPRREALGILSWPVGASIGSGPREGRISVPFTAPIYVNPGEFVAVAAKFLVGTATASQVIYHHITFDYGWE